MTFFWFWNRPLSDVPTNEWQAFLSKMWGTLGLIALVAVILFVLLYAWRMPKFKIRHPADPFRVPSRVWWLSWLLWALVPAVVFGFVYWFSFRNSAFAADINPTWGAITGALTCWAIVLVAFQILIWLPGITPRKFLYHPRWPWRLRKHTLRSTVVPARS